jgi:hypothetical protein
VVRSSRIQGEQSSDQLGVWWGCPPIQSCFEFKVGRPPANPPWHVAAKSGPGEPWKPGDLHSMMQMYEYLLTLVCHLDMHTQCNLEWKDSEANKRRSGSVLPHATATCTLNPSHKERSCTEHVGGDFSRRAFSAGMGQRPPGLAQLPQAPPVRLVPDSARMSPPNLAPFDFLSAFFLHQTKTFGNPHLRNL